MHIHFCPQRLQIVSKNMELGSATVQLIGDDGYGEGRELIVPHPSFKCINSWSRANRHNPFIESDPQTQLEKKALKSRWKAASDIMIEKANASHGLPDLQPTASNMPSSDADSVMLPSSSQPEASFPSRSRVPKGKNNTEDPRDLQEEVDGTLTIPGEAIYARMPRDKTGTHWPARVYAFSPRNPAIPRDFPGYEVVFLDDDDREDMDPAKKKKIRRSFFSTPYDDNFETIKVSD